MTVRSVDLATEDQLTEAVGLRLLAEWKDRLSPGLRLRKGGNGYLQSRIRSFAEIARRGPVLVITDLDRLPCVTDLRKRWLSGMKAPAGLILRVAVREIEAWILADSEAIRELLGRRAADRLPPNPDLVPDPKKLLLRLASSAPRDVRDDLRRETNGVALQNLGYNARLCSFVANTWSPARAAQRSESLRRARERLRALALE